MKVAIVTGGSRGIGRAICKRLAEDGVRVLINYSGNDKMAEETKSLCPGSETYKCDISGYDECEKMFKYCIDTFGSVDILINNAGITKDNLLMRMSGEDFDRVIAVNLKGAFNCTKLAYRPMLKAKSGRIINISSVVALSGNPGQANYCASKAGIIGMSKAVAKELASRGVTVNVITPGFIETDMTAELTQQAQETMLQTIPAGRAGTPEDIAALASFLCSDAAGYITGQVISVDGGMSM